MSLAVSLLARFDALDRALVAAGFPPTSPWWRKQVERFLRSGCRRWVIRAGRRAGKSSTLCRLAVLVALWGSWDVPPGDIGVVAFVSVSKDEASSRLRTIKAILKALRVKFVERGDELELVKRRALFKVFACSTDAVVGFTSIMIVGDEMAKWESRDTHANPAPETMGSLRPTMATQPTAFEVAVSSPWGTDDYHAELFDQGDNDQQCASFAPTWVANPTITEEQTHELEPDPRVWAREYAAVPGATLSAAFEPLDVAGCFRSPPDSERRGSFLTIDASSLRGDGFAWMGGHSTEADEFVVTAVDAWEGDELRRTSLADITEALAERAKDAGVSTILGDQREEAGLTSLFNGRGVGFKSFAWSEPSKDDAVMLLRRMMRERRLYLCEHAGLRRELTSMKARLMPSGRTKYETNGLDFASCLITLAHAALEGEISAGTDWSAALAINNEIAAEGGSRWDDYCGDGDPANAGYGRGFG